MFEELRHWLFPPRVDLSCVDPRFLRRTYTNVEWSRQDLQHFVPVGCRFESCKFEDAEMSDTCFGGGMEDTVYVNCSFDRSLITAVAAGRARFESCSFREVTFYEFFANRVEFVNCVFSGRLIKGVISGTRPAQFRRWWESSRNQIEKNDFSGLKFGDFDFSGGVDLKQQILPQSAEFMVLWNGKQAIRRARARVTMWTEDETKRLALIILDGLALDVSGGQLHLLFRVYPRGQLAAASARLAQEFEAGA
jgi:hypothetical protein